MSLAGRLTHHLREMEKNPPPLCHAQPEDPSKDIAHWIGYIDGPQNTPFDGGRFHLTIDFPLDYPFKPPHIRFTTPIYHPNIASNGEICLDILHSQWSPVLTTRTVLLSVCSLLTDPNPEHGLNKEALDSYRSNRQKYYDTAKQWTLKYAVDNKPIQTRF